MPFEIETGIDMPGRGALTAKRCPYPLDQLTSVGQSFAVREPELRGRTLKQVRDEVQRWAQRKDVAVGVREMPSGEIRVFRIEKTAKKSRAYAK